MSPLPFAAIRPVLNLGIILSLGAGFGIQSGLHSGIQLVHANPSPTTESLFKAVAADDESGIKTAIESGADLNWKDSNSGNPYLGGQSPLMHAVRENIESPLMHAVREIFNNYIDSRWTESALMHAVRENIEDFENISEVLKSLILNHPLIS
jgi:hypothetical protein